MKIHLPEVKRSSLKFLPDNSRVLIRPFIPISDTHIMKIIGRILTLTDKQVRKELDEVMQEFAGRHHHVEVIFERHYRKVVSYLFVDEEPPWERCMLIGAYFSNEFAFESTALFNPSIVPHPDQSDLPPGSLRFIMSFRATGEGHISSVEFRSGIINEQSEIALDPIQRYAAEPEMITDASYDKILFQLKLHEMGFENDLSLEILAPLNDNFTLQELNQRLKEAKRRSRPPPHHENRTLDCITWLAESNYELLFSEDQPLSERVIFPVSDNERNGIEDARFVQFRDDDGSVHYYATYTAYDGKIILPQLLETKDFLRFKVNTLNGRAVQNKGMALFPHKINGHYVMLSRQDNENIFIMFSDNIHFWHNTQVLLKPSQPWEFAKVGNCGSPIETEAGWIVLTHGVGPLRKYCIGAILLDLNDPSKVIGRLKMPLLKPNENEREGYVPNVVYTCGALVHGGKLIIPYAMSDFASSIATVSLDELINCLLEQDA